MPRSCIILLCARLIVDVHTLGVSLKLASTILGASLSEPHINGAAVCDTSHIFNTRGACARAIIIPCVC